MADDNEAAGALQKMAQAIGGGGAALALVCSLIVYIWQGHLSDSAVRHAQLEKDIKELEAKSQSGEVVDERQSTILERIEKRLDDDDDVLRFERWLNGSKKPWPTPRP